MEENQYRVIRIFKALSDPIRYGIIFKLSKVERLSVMDLSKLFEKPISTVSRHLRILKNLDIVNCLADGKYAYYYLKNKKIIEKLIELENIFKRK